MNKSTAVTERPAAEGLTATQLEQEIYGWANRHNVSGHALNEVAELLLERSRREAEDCGHPPIGYRFRDGRLIEHAGEQQVLAVARRRRAEGYSFQQIADFLNTAQAPCRHGRWHKTTLVRVFARDRKQAGQGSAQA